LRAVNATLAIYATYLDTRTAIYFNDTIKTCDFSGEPRCYCAATRNEYIEVFRVRSADCNNEFTRNPGYLIANAVLTGLCALLLVVYLFAFFWITLSNHSGGNSTGELTPAGP
jgi:hypothetical protein